MRAYERACVRTCVRACVCVCVCVPTDQGREKKEKGGGGELVRTLKQPSATDADVVNLLRDIVCYRFDD